jgi:hypothetical protein
MSFFEFLESFRGSWLLDDGFLRTGLRDPPGVMCGRPLGCKRKNENADGQVDCDHVFGLLDAASRPLAQMGSAIQSQTEQRP